MCLHHPPRTKQEKHDQEHSYWSRRSFLQALGIAGTGTMMLGSNMVTASSPSPLSEAISRAETDNILVLIRLVGGNDGLNTIIPINQYDAYANHRPNIYIPETKIIPLTDEYGIPSYMKGAEELWEEGQMKVVHGVGYPDQNMSHFQGSDNFATTDPTMRKMKTGYMGRYFENLYPDFLIDPPEIPAAIQIGRYSNLVFEGTQTNYAFVTANAEQLERIAESGLFYDVQDVPDCMYGDQLAFLRGMTNITYEYSGVIHEAYERGANQVEYDDNSFARQLAIVARLIKGNLGTKVYMVSIGGFDTHANQPLAHERLMSQLSNAVNHFYQDLEFTEMDDDVLSMTFSEFGRRVYENGSNGTDHGAAAPTLFFGSGLNGSAFVGEHPSIDETQLVRGNLAHTTDFRDLYATVLAEWLCIDQPLVDAALLGRPSVPINLGFSCNGSTFPDPDPDTASLDHKAIYPNANEPSIYMELPTAGHIVIHLFNILGQRVGTILNEMVFEGSHTVPVKENINTRLSTGQYIYRIEYQGKKYSKSMQIRA